MTDFWDSSTFNESIWELFLSTCFFACWCAWCYLSDPWLSTLRLFEPKTFYRYKTANQVLRSFATLYQLCINQLFVKLINLNRGKLPIESSHLLVFLYVRSVVSSFSMQRLWVTTEKKPIYFFLRPCLAAVLFCHNLSVIFPHFSCPFLDLCILPKRR